MKIFDYLKGEHLQVGEAKIYYEEIGDRTKPALLMLHGGFGNIKDLNGIASYLANDFRIIGIDTRGHGKSTLGDKELTYERVCLDIKAVLKHLGISKTNIIGFSDGGIAAYKIAAKGNVQVEKLVTIGSSWHKNEVKQIEDILKSITPQKAKNIFAEAYEEYQKINPNPNFELLANSLVSMWLDTTKSGYPNLNTKKIKAKTLIIRGDNDFLTSAKALAKLQGVIKDSSFMNVPFAAHEAHKEQPEMVKIAITSFLEI